MKMKCKECGWIGTDPLRGENPFNPDEYLTGCPECRMVETIVWTCDEPGCTHESTCGFTSVGGYRRTCGRHYLGYLQAEDKKGDS